MEYCRIVWDIFPPANDDWNDHRLIRMIVFNDKDTKKVIHDWERKHQSSSTLANELGAVSIFILLTWDIVDLPIEMPFVAKWDIYLFLT